MPCFPMEYRRSKIITIPVGFDRKDISELDVRAAQAFNWLNQPQCWERSLIDAILSYFILNCINKA